LETGILLLVFGKIRDLLCARTATGTSMECLECQDWYLYDARTEGPRVELRYRHVEAALAKVMNVGPKDMGAFRARLRHLRNIGVPRLLPNPGSGRPIDYSRRQALELLIALELENVGQAPKEVALLAGTIVRQSPYGWHKGKDCYAVISKSLPGVTMINGLRAFSEHMRERHAPDVGVLINVSACVRKLDPALDRALADD
jgi:hypothetical protein